jgi:hypothetical protein
VNPRIGLGAIATFVVGCSWFQAHPKATGDVTTCGPQAIAQLEDLLANGKLPQKMGSKGAFVVDRSVGK